jgi:hypothetical protein
MSKGCILRTLDFGLMMSIAYPIKRDEREAVAKFLGTAIDDTKPVANAFCKPADRRIMSASVAEAWSGWSPDSSNARFQSSASAGLKAGDVSHLQLKWAFGFAGDVTAFAAPTIVNGTMFV